MAGRSSIERLPPGILADVHEAIREGATIDDITGRIRALGGTCSRSAVCRYVRRARAVLQRRREVEGLADLWLGAPGEHAEGDTGRRALEALRALAMRSALALDGGEEPPDVDRIATLALAMQRIEGAGKKRRRPRGRQPPATPSARVLGALRRRIGAAGFLPRPSPTSAPPSRAIGDRRRSAVEGEAAVQAYWEEGIHHADAEPAERQDRHTPATRRLGSP